MKIEKGIPVPTNRRPSSTRREIMRQMKPGDSLLIPSEDRSGISSDMTTLWGKGNGTSRREEGGTRVWRIK